VIFDSGLQTNLIVIDLVNKLGMGVRGHANPYLLGSVNKDA
jgi:hypothetical protein